MIREERRSHFLRVMCDHPRCRVELDQEHSISGGERDPSAIRFFIDRGWHFEAPREITEKSKTKHFCPEHADEHRPDHAWVDGRKNQAEAFMSKDFPKTPPKKARKGKKAKKAPVKTASRTGDLFAD